MKNFLKCTLVLLILLSCISPNFALERRKEQFSKEPAYLIVPSPYSVPGIGEGVLFIIFGSNILGTNLDVAGTVSQGDIEGTAAGFLDLHLLSETLILDGGTASITKATVDYYYTRGIDSDKSDFFSFEIADVESRGGQLTLSFWERRLEFTLQHYISSQKIKKVRNSDGDVLLELNLDEQDASEVAQTSYQLVLDYTDDKLDPRRGLRLQVNYEDSPATNSGESAYNVFDYIFTAYIPTGNISTWAFNYFRSDAYVREQGETDLTALRENYGTSCDFTETGEEKSECEVTESLFLESQVARNRYGTATSLGGSLRLRSYPQVRFQGAHSRFWGTEFRFNLTEEFTPFNFYFMKDVKTGVQLAFFAERGTVADLVGDLWKETRSSYGFGARMLSGSGFVYRFDLAFGKEGMQTSILYTYPW